MLARFYFPAAVTAIFKLPPETSPDPQDRLAVLCADGALRVLDLQTGAVTKPAPEDRTRVGTGHHDPGMAVAWHPSGYLAFGDAEGVAVNWEPKRSDVPHWRGEGCSTPVLALAWHVSGFLAAGRDDGMVLVWHPCRGEPPVWCSRGHQDAVTAVAWLADGGLVSGSRDGTVAVWEPGFSRNPDPFSR